jgi:hypothetical protein
VEEGGVPLDKEDAGRSKSWPQKFRDFYCFSNSPLEVRFKTVNPACLARETEIGAESFGEFTV